MSYPDPIRSKLQVPQLSQPLEPFNPGNFILHEEDIRQLDKVRHIPDMLDLVEAEVQDGEVVEFIEVFDVGNEIIVKVQLFERDSDIRGKFNAGDLILTEAYPLYHRVVSCLSRSSSVSIERFASAGPWAERVARVARDKGKGDDRCRCT